VAIDSFILSSSHAWVFEVMEGILKHCPDRSEDMD
jgi:hypothetical protein